MPHATGQGKIILLDSERANVAAAVKAELSDFNVPFGLNDSLEPLIVYSLREKSGSQWINVINTTGDPSTRQVELGDVPEGMENSALLWLMAPDAVTFFGNRSGEGTIYQAMLDSGEVKTTDIGEKIIDAAVGANGHLYLAKGSMSNYSIGEYTLPDLALVKSMPCDHRPAAVIRQGQSIVVIEAVLDPLAIMLKMVFVPTRIFRFGNNYKYTLHRYDLELSPLTEPEELGCAAWFWHPRLEVLIVGTMNYKGPRLESKLPVSAMLFYAADGRCTAIRSAYFDLMAFDPSFSYAYFGCMVYDKQSIIEMNLSDFSIRSAEQRGFNIKINDKPYIQGFTPAYGGGSGVTRYLKAGKVAVLDFTLGVSREFECDAGAAFGARLGYWLLPLREESLVVYLPGRSQVVTYNNKAQKINIFNFIDGNLIKAIPFKARNVFLIDAGDGRHVLVRTPGQWQILDLEGMSLTPFLEEDGGSNQDSVDLYLQADKRTIYLLREEVCYIIDPATQAVLTRIPLTDIKFDKEGYLAFEPFYSLSGQPGVPIPDSADVQWAFTWSVPSPQSVGPRS